MTNYAQPKGIEDWPEDLRRRYLEAMRLRQLELENQAVGGATQGSRATLSPEAFAQRQSNAPIPMATDKEINALMQQEKLQSLLKQASTEGSTGGSPFSLISSAQAAAPSTTTVPEETTTTPERFRLGSWVAKQAKALSEHTGKISRKRLEEMVEKGITLPLPANQQPVYLLKRLQEKERVEKREAELEATVAKFNRNAPSVIAKSRVVPTPAPAPAPAAAAAPPKGTSDHDDFMRRIWGQLADDPRERKKMYLSQLNKIYAKSMLLDGWAKLTGGKSYAGEYVTAATDILDKTEKFDAEARLHDLWKAAMFKDGEYYPADTQADLYERLQALGARPDEIEKFSKGFSGKAFRGQPSFDARPTRLQLVDNNGKPFSGMSNDPKIIKGLNDGTYTIVNTLSIKDIEGRNLYEKMKTLGKRYKSAIAQEDKAALFKEGYSLLLATLANNVQFLYEWQQVYGIDPSSEAGKRELVLLFMGVKDPSGGRVELNQ